MESVMILVVVIYLAFMPTPQSIWKIEKSEVMSLIIPIGT